MITKYLAHMFDGQEFEIQLESALSNQRWIPTTDNRFWLNADEIVYVRRDNA